MEKDKQGLSCWLDMDGSWHSVFFQAVLMELFHVR